MTRIDLDDLERRMNDHDVIGGSAVVLIYASEVQWIIEELREARGESSGEVPERERLTNEWFHLHAFWPSDGWDGAAQARADHDRKVKAVEAQLAEIHEEGGHGPFECYSFGTSRPTGHRCICDKANDLKAGISDPRWFNGRKATDGEVLWITDPEHPYFRGRNLGSGYPVPGGVA